MEICSAIIQGMLLNEQSSDWWLETSWRSCGVTVITPFRYYRFRYNDYVSSERVWMSHWFRWWLVACSALSHYLNQLKDRWFETSCRSCCVTVITMLQNVISVLHMITSPMSVEFSFVISQVMLLNKQSSDWWLEISRRSCGVTVITTPFRYYAII